MTDRIIDTFVSRISEGSSRHGGVSGSTKGIDIGGGDVNQQIKVGGVTLSVTNREGENEVALIDENDKLIRVDGETVTDLGTGQAEDVPEIVDRYGELLKTHSPEETIRMIRKEQETHE